MSTIAFSHRRFGTLEVSPETLLDFDGLPGFPELRRAFVVEHDRNPRFGWLLFLEHPELAFVVVDPRAFFPDYVPAPSRQELRCLDAKPDSEIDLLCIATVSRGVMSLNLAAPIFVNAQSRRGVQAILEGSPWPLKAQILPPPAPEAPTAQIESKPQV